MERVTEAALVGLCGPNENGQNTEKVRRASHLIHWLCCACCSVVAVLCVCSSCSSGLCSNLFRSWQNGLNLCAPHLSKRLDARGRLSLKEQRVRRVEYRVYGWRDKVVACDLSSSALREKRSDDGKNKCQMLTDQMLTDQILTP